MNSKVIIVFSLLLLQWTVTACAHRNASGIRSRQQTEIPEVAGHKNNGSGSEPRAFGRFLPNVRNGAAVGLVRHGDGHVVRARGIEAFAAVEKRSGEMFVLLLGPMENAGPLWLDEGASLFELMERGGRPLMYSGRQRLFVYRGEVVFHISVGSQDDATASVSEVLRLFRLEDDDVVEVPDF